MKEKKTSIPEKAIRIHLYPFKNILRPRGTMAKESLGISIYEKLKTVFEDWSDLRYDDNPVPILLINKLHENLMDEVDAAWKKFLNEQL